MAAPNFNYDGDLDAEQTPIIDRMNKEYTIYVNNIPAELNEIAIRQLFSDYGRIIEMRSAKGWAYITYGLYYEAELAIRELNNKRPLDLQIILLRQSKQSSNKKDDTESSNEIQQNQIYAEHAKSLSGYDPIDTEKMIRGHPVNALRKHNLLPQGTQSINDRSLLSSSNNQEFEKLLLNTSRLWTRGVVTVTPDGKRRVSLGRGYSLYELPDEDPKLEEYIDKVYERRNAGLYEYSKDKLPSGLKSCSLCSTKTTQRCEKCYTYYCSKVCQVKDWPRHQAECDRIPALVEDRISDISPLHTKEENPTEKIQQLSASNKTVIPQSTASSNVRLRRPNISNTTQIESPSNTVNNNTDKNNIGYNLNNNGDDQDRHSSLPITNSINRSQLKKESPLTNGIDNKNSSQNRSQYSDENIGQQIKNNTSLSPQSEHNNRSYQTKAVNKRNSNRENFENDDNMRGRSQSYQKNGHQNNGSASYNDRETTKQENNAFTVPRNTQYLSKTKFTDVEVTVRLDNNECWICKYDDIQARNDFMTQLEHLAIKSRNLKPIVGSVYGVLSENIWYRAMVKTLDPVNVRYIDYGNDKILKENAVFKDIRDLLQVPNFAQKIRFLSNDPSIKSLRSGDKISVKMLFLDADDTMVVEIQGTSKDSLQAERTAQSNMNITVKEPASQRNLQASMNSSKQSVAQENSEASVNTSRKSVSQENLSVNASKKASERRNVLDLFIKLLAEKEELSESERSGVIEIHERLENNVYNATLCPHFFSKEVEMIYHDMQIDCKNMKNVNCNPQADELICGKEISDRWQRGYVHSSDSTSSSIYIRTLDALKIIKVNEVLPCPKIYQNIFAFGVTCIPEEPIQRNLEGDVYQFEAVVNKHAQQILKIKLLVENSNDTKEVIPVVVKLPSSDVPAVRSELTSGTKVCVTSFQSHYIAFVRSLDDEEVKYYNDIMLRVAKCAQTASFLTKSPNIDQAVIAPYVDDNSYRATVLKLLEDDNVMIQYTDFGNLYTLKRQKLQVIPDDLAKERSCSIKVLLKDVPRDVAITKEADIYLQELADDEVPLTCIHVPSEDGVYLITATGERINDKIKELLLSKTDNNKKYMLSDIRIAKLGPVNAVVSAIVTYTQKSGVNYMLAASDSNLLNQMLALSPLMKKYCENSKYYIPKKNELCLALYDGDWYRAACMNPKESQTTAKIFFIDYGNTEIVEYQDIREIHKNFMQLPAMANECKVINLAPVDSTGHPSTAVQQKLAELMDNYASIQIKIVEITKDNVMIIELPHIRQTLIENGLVS